MVKNAVIIPVGAKGGFVVKRREQISDPDVLRREVADCYRAFVAGLLDVTDNVVDGAVVPPPDVVRHDGDDPYLVVAADKGTATFSDLANEVAASYGFWLGDAFASGGSAGYDHKAMGITARGRVGERPAPRPHARARRRHRPADRRRASATCRATSSATAFCAAPTSAWSPRSTTATSSSIPTPTRPGRSQERLRLFELPRSSWDDYDRTLISAGGGVWPRSAKSIVLSEEAQRALDFPAATATPNELLSAILKAPVDLLWNGGIGTYVKASTENNAEVGDRANDAIRVDGVDLRCAMVVEGGNLGLTQRGRVEAALNGVLLNTDAIDNCGRRGLLGPRGQHQDPDRRPGRRGRPHRQAAQRAPGVDDRRRGRAGAGGQPRPDAGAGHRPPSGRADGGRARPLPAFARSGGPAQPGARVPAHRQAAGRAGQCRPGLDHARVRSAPRLHEGHQHRRRAGFRPARRSLRPARSCSATSRALWRIASPRSWLDTGCGGRSSPPC